LIAEFSVGFEKASDDQRLTCLPYLAPWIRNLSMFCNPTNEMYDMTSGKLKDCVHLLVDMTVKFPAVITQALVVHPCLRVVVSYLPVCNDTSGPKWRSMKIRFLTWLWMT
jgi:hypothetical protein